MRGVRGFDTDRVDRSASLPDLHRTADPRRQWHIANYDIAVRIIGRIQTEHDLLAERDVRGRELLSLEPCGGYDVIGAAGVQQDVGVHQLASTAKAAASQAARNWSLAWARRSTFQARPSKPTSRIIEHSNSPVTRPRLWRRAARRARRCWHVVQSMGRNHTAGWRKHNRRSAGPRSAHSHRRSSVETVFSRRISYPVAGNSSMRSNPTFRDRSGCMEAGSLGIRQRHDDRARGSGGRHDHDVHIFGAGGAPGEPVGLTIGLGSAGG